MEIELKVQLTLNLTPHPARVLLTLKEKSRANADIKIWSAEINFDHDHEIPLTEEVFNHLRKTLRKHKTDVFKVKNRYSGYRYYTIRGFGVQYWLTEIKHPKLQP